MAHAVIGQKPHKLLAQEMQTWMRHKIDKFCNATHTGDRINK